MKVKTENEFSSMKSMVYLLMKFAKHTKHEEETVLKRILFEELRSWFGDIERSSDEILNESIRTFVRDELIEGDYGTMEGFLIDFKALGNLFMEDVENSWFYGMVSSVLAELYSIRTDRKIEVADHVSCTNCLSDLYVRVGGVTCPRCLRDGCLTYPNGIQTESNDVKVPDGEVVEWVNKDFIKS
ncbi:hypothetical protein [Paenibacillus periandrae]|uniref:hypothetical protein n=1 Tax=Paenibacillus periandrae TaxID=1761741 RepID=UPI001F09E207|nr:hypothetical protein [Paenibacillus periandrae]